MENLAVNLTLQSLKDAHQNLHATMEDVTDEIAAFIPPGKANPIAGTYAHLVFSEDFFLNTIIKRSETLFDTSWKNKTGISEQQPTEWKEAYPKWLKTVKIDVDQAQKYARAVFLATEEYVESLTDEDLEKNADMSAFGMEARSIGSILGGMIIGHANNITGEISVLKGIQGLKGYPF